VRNAADYSNSTIQWYVPYADGKIEAIGINDGKQVASHQLQTAGKTAKLVLRPDRTRITADGQDLVHIELNLADTRDLLVPDGDRLINWKVEGEGRLIGVDSGDLRRSESYQGPAHTTYWGKGLAVIQATRNSGTIRVTATAEDLPPASLSIQSRQASE
jgi:beta-galactosidase